MPAFAYQVRDKDGKKMSKSLGNVVNPFEVVARYGVDPYRYFLLRDVPFGQDGTFSEEALQARYTNDLANDLGNLVQRTLIMVEKYAQGKVPPKPMGPPPSLLAQPQIEKAIESADFSGALILIWSWINERNRLIEDNRPWELAKQKKQELLFFLYNLLEDLRTAAILIHPFLPKTSAEIFNRLGLSSKDLSWNALSEWGILEPGTPLKPGGILFPKLS